MFETLFGAEMPLAIRFLLAFLISLGLIGAIIGAATWAARRFGPGRLGETSTRALEPRLAVVAYANVDERRQLILVRRDNVEHLLMIGWWADVIVEPNIARAVSEPHEAVVARSPVAAEPLPRGIPLPDKGSWPPLLEPTDAERPAPRTKSSPEEPAASPLQPQGETTPRSQRYAPAPLADELSTLPPAPHKSPTAVTRPHLTQSRPNRASNTEANHAWSRGSQRCSRPRPSPPLRRLHPRQMKPWRRCCIALQQRCASRMKRPLRADPQHRRAQLHRWSGFRRQRRRPRPRRQRLFRAPASRSRRRPMPS